jgi:uncharacterized cupredoxin-like copper-binding protein
MSLTRALLLTAATLGLFGTSCANGGSGSGSDGVDVTLSDFRIGLSSTSLDAGSVTFTATNDGPSTHEFEVFRVPGDADVDELPVSDGVADTARLELIDEVEDIAPSTTAELRVPLEAGSYALICNLPGHYQQGMRVAFTVA